LVHGSPDALSTMETLVQDRVGVKAYAPHWQETIQLTKGLDFSARELQNTYESVKERFENFVQLQPGQKEKEHVMSQLKELERALARTDGW